MGAGLRLDYPAWFILLCLLAGAVYAFGLYYRSRLVDKDAGHPGFWRYVLMGLRFVLVSLLAFLLLGPLVRTTYNESEDPIILVGLDNSESIKEHWKLTDSAQYHNALDDLITGLSKDYEVRTFTIGDELLQDGDLNYSDKVTDLSTGLRDLTDLYLNRNVGAIILATDGIYNKGNSPVYGIGNLSAPIYSIALGDTIPKKDLWVRKVYHNKIAYLNDQFGIRIDIGAYNLTGSETQVTVSRLLRNGTEKVYSGRQVINAENFESTIDVVINAKAVGVQAYRISLSAVSGEASLANNVKDIYIEILDSRKKVLLLANSPHPDVSAIKQSLEFNKNYQVEVAYGKDFTGKIAEYNLVILDQLPSRRADMNRVLAEALTRNIPLLFVVGSQTDINLFNKAQNLVDLRGHRPGQTNEVAGLGNSDFGYFNVESEVFRKVSKFPPLVAPFGNYLVSPNTRNLMVQKIGTVTTDYPLWSFEEGLNTKNAVILGEGIWKWRLHDFLNNGNHDVFNELIGKTLQYLTVKEDKRKFRVIIEKNVFDENETVQFDAELYNNSYELVNEPDVKMTIQDEAGNEFPYTFNKTDKAYTLDVGAYGVGRYTFKAVTSYDGETYTATGNFAVRPIQLEGLRTTADHALLNLLADRTGGKLIQPSEMNLIPELIAQNANIKPIIDERQNVKSFIELKWLFFVLLLFLGTEWFFRKWLGGY